MTPSTQPHFQKSDLCERPWAAEPEPRLESDYLLKDLKMAVQRRFPSDPNKQNRPKTGLSSLWHNIQKDLKAVITAKRCICRYKVLSKGSGYSWFLFLWEQVHLPQLNCWNILWNTFRSYIVTCCKMNGCIACIYKKGTQMTPDIMDQDQPTWFLKSPWDGYLWDQDWGPHTSRLETVFETKTQKTWIKYWIARRGTENVRFSHWLGRTLVKFTPDIQMFNQSVESVQDDVQSLHNPMQMFWNEHITEPTSYFLDVFRLLHCYILELRCSNDFCVPSYWSCP